MISILSDWVSSLYLVHYFLLSFGIKGFVVVVVVSKELIVILLVALPLFRSMPTVIWGM
jgi:hypothetical protein